MMKKLIDLHVHSQASDGSFSPEELMKLANECNISAIAITDHDTIDGLDEGEFYASKYNIEFIPGIELSAKYETEMHILGLYINHKNNDLLNVLCDLEKSREKRNKATISKLNNIGIDISFKELEEFAHGKIFGRAHIAKLMVKKRYVTSTKEAFKLYLGHGKIGFCQIDRKQPKEIIEIIKNAGGLAFLAHCHLLKKTKDDFQELLRELKSYGLDGIEGYYTEYTTEQQEYYINTALENNLLVSGGSDFHGSLKDNIVLGVGNGNLNIPYSVLEQIKERLER